MTIEDMQNYVRENNIKWYLRSVGWVELSEGKWINTKDSSIKHSLTEAYESERSRWYERASV